MSRAPDWFRQAENDLLWADDTLAAGRFAQACFVAQQVCEKSLKALALSRGFDQVRSHSLLNIVRALGINGDLEQMARRLDQYYVTARYPDAFVEGAPFEYFTREQAEEAIGFAREFVARIRPEVAGDS